MAVKRKEDPAVQVIRLGYWLKGFASLSKPFSFLLCEATCPSAIKSCCKWYSQARAIDFVAQDVMTFGFLGETKYAKEN